MKKIKEILLVTVIILNVFIFSGCWDYTQIDKLEIVAGIAIDKNENTNEYILTTEVLEPILGARENQLLSKVIQIEGKSLFDSIRNTISKTSKRLYFSHTKVVIISKKIAQTEILPIIDIINRDAELRGDMKILISKEDTAGEILNNLYKKETNIISYDIDKAFTARKSLSKYPEIDVWGFVEELMADGMAPIVPGIQNEVKDGIPGFKVDGSYAFKRDKSVGCLDGRETKSALWLRDDIKSGAIVVQSDIDGETYKNTLEIFNNKTQIKPIKKNGKIALEINIELDSGIVELDSEKNFIDKKKREILKMDAEKLIKRDIERVIDKAQIEFESDIFGFSSIINREMPKEWKKNKKNWEEEFKKLDTNVQVKVNIRNSALISKPIKIGE
ncbi:Ger(x)C family spore germination protein [Clostridium aestuarii]|uniref:Ger(X)C family spore germination protein n=1 Tax=Clostridium aestuarii TaxID=338193 RepID=A0ABT4D1R7_9CLOT|nr:Ger(x)C family spore germination protein [Clostridium aestuarii]MCY6485190.1 Ger(x)C family spore germination protein [Clostridium aestuarii]